MNLEEFKAELLRRFPWEPEAKFMAVDADGKYYQYTNYPKVFALLWGRHSGAAEYVGFIELPVGIDWRETLVSRAETDKPTQPIPTTNSNDAKVWLQIYCSIIATGHSPDLAANSADYAFDEYKKRFPNG